MFTCSMRTLTNLCLLESSKTMLKFVYYYLYLFRGMSLLSSYPRINLTVRIFSLTQKKKIDLFFSGISEFDSNIYGIKTIYILASAT